MKKSDIDAYVELSEVTVKRLRDQIQALSARESEAKSKMADLERRIGKDAKGTRVYHASDGYSVLVDNAKKVTLARPQEYESE